MASIPAALDILYTDDLKNGMNSSYSSIRPGAKQQGIFINYDPPPPPISSEDHCLLFCLYPYPEKIKFKKVGSFFLLRGVNKTSESKV